jgi:hypothetical protein
MGATEDSEVSGLARRYVCRQMRNCMRRSRASVARGGEVRRSKDRSLGEGVD